MPGKKLTFLSRLTSEEEKYLIKSIQIAHQKETETDTIPDLIVKICGKCGTHNDADAVFCKSCGKRLITNTDKSDSTPAPAPIKTDSGKVKEDSEYSKVNSYFPNFEDDVKRAYVNAIKKPYVNDINKKQTVPENKPSSHVRSANKNIKIAITAIILVTVIVLGIFIIIKITETKSYDIALENASKIEEACNDYYACVVAGTITSSNKYNVVSDTLPKTYDTTSTRKNLANMTTVAGALEYAGLTDLKDTIGEFSYVDKSNYNYSKYIYANIDPDKPSEAKPLTLKTTMGDIFEVAESMEYASEIENACKDYYACVVAGTITSSNKYNVVSDTLPKTYDTTSTRKNLANMTTVAGALEYAGLTDLKDTIGEFSYVDKSNYNYSKYIYANIDPDKPSEAKPLTLKTTMGDIFKE